MARTDYKVLLDDYGKPLMNVQGKAYRLDTHAWVESSDTDTNGKATFDELPDNIDCYIIFSWGLYHRQLFWSEATIDTTEIVDGAVETAKINDLAVTTAKIDNLAVTTAKINALAVTTAKIDSLAVTDAKINDCAVSKLTAGTITSKTITLAISGGTGDVKIQAGKTDFTNTETGFILGMDDSDSDKPKFYIGSSTAYLNWDGSALTVVGAVTSTSGTIGGFTLSSTALYAGATTTRIQLDTTSGIHLGATAFADAPFNVSLAGVLTATGATIRTGADTGARIKLDATYLAGYSDATTKQFYISATDGKAYFGAGDCTMGSGGLQVTGTGKVILNAGSGNVILLKNLGDIRFEDDQASPYWSGIWQARGGGWPTAMVIMANSTNICLAVPETGVVHPYFTDSCDLGNTTYEWRTIICQTVTMHEGSTPTAVADYGKLYTKNDNKLYFQDGAGTEHEVAYV